MSASKLKRTHIVGTAAILIATVLVVSLVLPVQAQALDVERWTAKSNQDGERGIMGATPTRITWQG